MAYCAVTRWVLAVASECCMIVGTCPMLQGNTSLPARHQWLYRVDVFNNRTYYEQPPLKPPATQTKLHLFHSRQCWTLKSLIVKFENFEQSRLTVFFVVKSLFIFTWWTAVLKIVSIFEGTVVRSNFAIFFCSILLVLVRSAQTAHVVYTLCWTSLLELSSNTRCHNCNCMYLFSFTVR